MSKLDGAAVQNWLAPIATLIVENNAEIRHLQAKSSPDKNVNSASLSKKKNNKSTEEELRQAYWDTLAAQSFGAGEIAANLWLQSLRIKQDALANDKQ